MPNDSRYYQYLETLKKPFKKLTKIEFLQPDNSIAFSLSNNYKQGYMTKYNSRAFISDGALNVSLQNGQRRKASLRLSNLDDAFEFAVNKLWFGKKIRLSMGLVLPDGTDFYLPQGVFYIANPQNVLKPNEKTVSFSLVDKWSYLDGSLFGILPNTYSIINETDLNGKIIRKNIFKAMQGLLTLSKYNFEPTTDIAKMIDNVVPVFTNYYNNKTYTRKIDDSSILETLKMTDLPYTISEKTGSTLAKLLLDLNEIIVGVIGYDQVGALRVDASQDDINDKDKPVLWAFDKSNCKFLGLTENIKISEAFNDVLIVGESISKSEIWGRATNYDARFDTNVNIIGQRTYYEANANYTTTDQCISLAKWKLKRKTALQKAISIESPQIFHLVENKLISIQRPDKKDSPVEKHLIQSFSLPIAETGNMNISAISINDFPNFNISSNKMEGD